MNKYKTIGIIGGQGPVSTADLYMRIVKYYQDNFGAKYVRDFPPMIIFSVPTPDLIEGIEDEETTFSMIADATKKLEQNGCDFIIIACNSLQFLIERLQTLVKIPIISIASIVEGYIRNKDYKTIGILATDTTIKKDIYGKLLKSAGIKLLIPNEADQKNVEKIILNEIGGKASINDAIKLKNIISNFEKHGAESVLLACTELPLVIKQSEVGIPLIDCNALYAQGVAKLATKP